MQSPAHFVVGAALCRHVRWKPAGLAIAFASHFALDAIPHFEDPSILPRWLSPWAGRNWELILLSAQLALIPLTAAVWLRFTGDGKGGARRAAYMIAGGLLACTPDYISRFMHGQGVVAWLNSAAHLSWVRPYLWAVRTHYEWRPLIVLICLGLELAVFVVGAWALFRRAKLVSREEGDGQT
jgi:hypothetical protein